MKTPDDRDYTCSCCDFRSPLLVDCTPYCVDDDDNEVLKSSSDSTDSTAEWYQQQVTHIKHDVSADFRHQQTEQNPTSITVGLFMFTVIC